jgi:hypothetical protein
MRVKPEGYQLLFPIVADDGSPCLLTKDQIEYVITMQYLKAKRKEAIEQHRHNKLMRKTKKRIHFNPRLN